MRFNVLDHITLPRPLALVISLAFLLCMGFAIFKLPQAWDKFESLPAGYDSVLFTAGDAPADGSRNMAYGTTEAVSKTIFEGFPLAFEIVSLLIFAAVLGAVLLARRHLAAFDTPAAAAHEPEKAHHQA